MLSRLASATAVVLAASSLVAAQTKSACDPTKKDGCPDNTAIGTTVEIDFTKGKSDFFKVADGTSLTYDPKLGAVFTINKETDAPTIASNGYIFFGKVDLTVRASLGVGIVTSCVLQSDDLDEIDWEWLGGDTTQVQTNYFSKGDTTTYDRGGFSKVSDPQNTFRTYTIDWTKERLIWAIDGVTVRTLTYADAKNGATYPQTPMQLKLGTWVAGRKDAPQGTVQWAGGHTNFNEAPFLGYYQKVVVQDYSNGVANAKKYVWGDKTGTYGSIKVETSDGDVKSSSLSASSTASASSSGKDASSTFSTVASSSTASANSTATGSSSLATGTGSSHAVGSSSSAGASATSTSSSGSADSTPVTAGAISKSGVNFALLGAVLFAFVAL